MSSKKAIQINPEYFSLKKNRSLKKEPREKKPKNKTGKQQKKELLRRLKEIQDNKHNKKSTEVKTTPHQDTIESSIHFLNTLASEHKDKEKDKKQENQDNIPPIFKESAIKIEPSVTTETIPKFQVNNEPPYSNLKGSNKPSYREWLKRKSNTEKIHIEHKDPTPQPINTERHEKLKKIQKKYKKSNKHSKTIKITETFGKRNGKVSIHIKNNENKQILENEKKTLKKHSIPKIKAYLKEHNLLKIGSYAPNDVIRELYENAMLSGNITNNNKDILVHNFLET